MYASSICSKMAFHLDVLSLVLCISLCTSEHSERQCSRYHYEEQILAKLVRLEHRLELLEDISKKGSLTPHQTYTQCADTWIPFQGSCYLFSEGKRTFSEAVIHCAQFSAHLVYVENEQENAFLKSYLNGLKDPEYWIGLSDVDLEGSFKWQGTDIEATYTNWGESQPDNSGDIEDCVHFYRHTNAGMKWNDHRCTVTFKPICEKKQSDFNHIQT